MVVSESFEESEICRSNDGGERLEKMPFSTSSIPYFLKTIS